MTTSVYLCAQPDYFPVIYTPATWEKTLTQLENVPKGSVLCLDGEGLSTTGKVSACWQKIKSFLGFQDLTDEVKIGAFLARFIFQGAAQGYMQKHKPRIVSLRNKMDTGQLRVQESIKDFFKFDEIVKLKSKDLQQKVVSYFSKNKERLNPSFWNRICAKTIDLPIQARFGDTSLVLAKETRYISPLETLEQYKIAAQFCSPDDAQYSQDLVKEFSHFLVTSQYPDKGGNITLLLAERTYRLDNYPEASRLFQSAAQLKAPFTEKQKVWQLHVSSQLQQHDAVERLADSIDVTNEDLTIKRLFAKAVFKLGDHYFSKVGTVKTRAFRILTLGATPSSEAHSQKAAKFYRMALLASRQDPELLPLHQSIFDKNLDLNIEPLPVVTDFASNLSPSEQLVQMNLIIGAMQRKNPLDDLTTTQARKQIGMMTTRLMKFYLESGPDRCLPLIDKTLKSIGDIKKRFKITTKKVLNDLTKKTESHQVIECTTANLVNSHNHFNFDVGASLHFMRAEILRKEIGDVAEVRDEYKLATNLAPLNFLGAEALFTIDNQEKQSTLVSDINSYRNFAIEWGSQELKDFVAQIAANS